MGTGSTQQFEVLWQDGEGWRDLAPQVVEAQRVTVVTRSGTTHLLDLEDGTVTRIPSAGSSHLRMDGERFRIDSLVAATPCGLVIRLGQDRYRCTTGVHLLLEGHHRDWVGDFGPSPGPQGAVGRFSDHPPVACNALYCGLRSIVMIVGGSPR